MKLRQQIQYHLNPASRYIDSGLGAFEPVLEEVNRLHGQLRGVADGPLQQKAEVLLARGRGGAHPDELLVEAYALAKEACIRQLGLHPFDEQLIAAVALHQGKLAEMQAGEGKTLAAVFPAYLNALSGRGTDIVLGGKDEKEKEKVVQLGGLYVIGANRHESARIDRQLRGRAGRQGDVGSSRFFTSLEDDLMEKYKLKDILPRKYQGIAGDEPIESPQLRAYIDTMQRIIENRLFDMRKQLYDYAAFIEIQRSIFQVERQHILFGRREASSPGGWLWEFWNIYMGLDGRRQQELKTLSLFEFDRSWAAHLDQLWELRENIHLVRLGGQNPLREFRTKADEYFQSMQQQLEAELNTKAAYLAGGGSLAELGVERPSATWSYVVNEAPFSNQLALMLMDNSNIGLQVDFVSAFLLFFHGLFRRLKRRGRGK